MMKMRMINMSINSEESFKDDFYNALKVFWKRFIYYKINSLKKNTLLIWKNMLIIELIFNPCH